MSPGWLTVTLAFSKIPRSCQQEYYSVSRFPAHTDALPPPRAELSTCSYQTPWGFCWPSPQGYWGATGLKLCQLLPNQVQVPFTDLLRVHPRSSSKSLLKMLNNRRTVGSQILDKDLLMTTEVWHEQCSQLPLAGVKNRLPSCLCCLSYRLLTVVSLFPLVQRQESFRKGDVKGVHP